MRSGAHCHLQAERHQGRSRCCRQQQQQQGQGRQVRHWPGSRCAQEASQPRNSQGTGAQGSCRSWCCRPCCICKGWCAWQHGYVPAVLLEEVDGARHCLLLPDDGFICLSLWVGLISPVISAVLVSSLPWCGPVMASCAAAGHAVLPSTGCWVGARRPPVSLAWVCSCLVGVQVWMPVSG